jgi:GDP/UDP-N,N'-diacetylbacillosamine 2-epimerase (hydrolysing)
MGGFVVKIGLLTSSRADYGIYLPLIKELKKDRFFSLDIIAFGTHLSRLHGYTIDTLTTDNNKPAYSIETIMAGDTPNSISSSAALTSMKFAEFWNEQGRKYDLVFCLGDRYEMFAAVSAGIPYNIKFAHLHGGEETLGAIDNIYRHCITHASFIHFVTTEEYKKRIESLIGHNRNIYVTGSLSLDNLNNLKLLTINELKDKFYVDLSVPTILSTFHPETVSIEKNKLYAGILSDTFLELSDDFQIVITLPNADTESMVLRKAFLALPDQSNNNIICVENFGTLGYFSCMKHAKLLIGNTSSGIIEAASFNKQVINLGDRQKGRLSGENVINLPVNKEKIIRETKKIVQNPIKQIENPYYKRGAVNIIIDAIKKLKN